MSKSERTRAHILSTAEQLLESGDSASMASIAEAAGVTRQLLYVHFSGRADLLLELSRQVDARVRTPERQRRVDTAPDGRSALVETVALQGWIKPRIASVADAIDRLRATDSDAAAAWNEREHARRLRCRAVVRRLEREGSLGPTWTVARAADLVWSCTSQRAWAELVRASGWSTAAWVRHTTELLVGALVGPQGAEHP